jgi:hypothetical protein
MDEVGSGKFGRPACRTNGHGQRRLGRRPESFDSALGGMPRFLCAAVERQFADNGRAGQTFDRYSHHSAVPQHS